LNLPPLTLKITVSYSIASATAAIVDSVCLSKLLIKRLLTQFQGADKFRNLAANLHRKFCTN